MRHIDTCFIIISHDEVMELNAGSLRRFRSSFTIIRDQIIIHRRYVGFRVLVILTLTTQGWEVILKYPQTIPPTGVDDIATEPSGVCIAGTYVWVV